MEDNRPIRPKKEVDQNIDYISPDKLPILQEKQLSQENIFLREWGSTKFLDLTQSYRLSNDLIILSPVFLYCIVENPYPDAKNSLPRYI